MTTNNDDFLVAVFNSEIKRFLQNFKEFQKLTKVSTVNLLENLVEVTDEIEKFLDKTETVDKNLDGVVSNFDKEFVKSYHCMICEKTIFGPSYHDIKQHTQSKMHKKYVNGKHLPNLQEKPSGQNESLENGEGVSRRKERNMVRKIEREKNIRQKTERKQIVQSEKRIKQFLSKPLNLICKNAIAEGRALREYEKHDKIRDHILQLVSPTYPNAKVHFFGSRFNGLGCKDSDIDIFIQLEFSMNDCFELPNTSHYIDFLKSSMQQSKQQRGIWSNYCPIKDAKVPILKVRYMIESIDCDISFSNPFGVYNTLLINHILEMQPLCYNMCILMKFIYKLSLCKKQFSSFNTYSMVLMVIFYLQTVQLLPSIKTLQSGQESNVGKVGLWTVTFLPKTLNELEIRKEADDSQTTMKYLIKMLQFYLNLDFKANVISPYLGKLVPVNTFEHDIKNHMPSLSKYLIEDKCQPLKITEIIVQDPFILNCNVTQNISDPKLKDILNLFSMVSKELLSLEASSTANVNNIENKN